MLQFASGLAASLEACHIQYYVSKPVVCCLYGDATRQDKLVVVAAIDPSHVPDLTTVLSQAFYVYPDDIVQTSLGGGGFALRHPQNQQIAEVWQHQLDAFSATKMERRMLYQSALPSHPRTLPATDPFWICTLEDAILDRLLFEPSSRSSLQWQGLLAILRAQSPYLDYAYLGEWAGRLGVSRTLGQALLEAEI
jgi:hypothetical protein